MTEEHRESSLVQATLHSDISLFMRPQLSWPQHYTPNTPHRHTGDGSHPMNSGEDSQARGGGAATEFHLLLTHIKWVTCKRDHTA